MFLLCPVLLRVSTQSSKICSISGKLFKRMVSSKSLSSLTDEEKKSFLDSFDSVLFDCDGVLWIGGTAIAGAVDVVQSLNKCGKKTFYVTNNSTQTRAEYVQKCSRLRFPAEESNIISTAWLTAKYLKSINFSKKVYIVGPKSVKTELANVGIESFGIGADPINPSKVTGMSEIEPDQIEGGVGAVVVGYDLHFSVPKMVRACTYLNNPECIFIGTNTDERFPHKSKNIVLPGTGSFVMAVQTAAERKPTIMGKPSTIAVDVIKELGVDPKKSLMVGDRCNTDIHFGNKCGMTTLLVETGVNSLQDLEKFEEENQTHLLPTYYTASIADLLSFFN